ncbi:DNA mismatch repair protein MutL [Striga asiatica]|uniref:DNA mismatch repair protein MutL n=1 Tax=Striga asiatica TaxID=4170 RepID=A0A5A7RC64_STRAF|nr:DNA mismatch repair protein MutL [Striga asiatica]
MEFTLPTHSKAFMHLQIIIIPPVALRHVLKRKAVEQFCAIICTPFEASNCRTQTNIVIPENGFSVFYRDSHCQHHLLLEALGPNRASNGPGPTLALVMWSAANSCVKLVRAPVARARLSHLRPAAAQPVHVILVVPSGHSQLAAWRHYNAAFGRFSGVSGFDCWRSASAAIAHARPPEGEGLRSSAMHCSVWDSSL